MVRTPFTRIAGLLAALAFVASCNDSGSPDVGDPPVLPALQSMNADLTFFASAGGGGLVAEGATAQSEVAAAGSHFLTGALSVAIANLWTTVVMAIPVATWAAAASDSPEFSNGAFHWEYAVSEGNQTFMADLAGSVEGSESVWEMRITASALNPPLDDYLWYTGRAALTGSEGEWHIFDAGQPSTRKELLRIDWTHPSTNAWTLTFTNVNSGAPEAGDMLRYEVNGSERIVMYTDASASTTVEVGWNASTSVGYVHGPNYNGGVRSCWNATLDNVACP